MKEIAPFRNLISKYLLGAGILHNAPKVSSCKSHCLMVHAQLIAPSTTGAFNFLPLGLRSLEKLCKVVDDEMSNIGCMKVDMSCLSNASPWMVSGRWEKMGDELMKLKVGNADHCLNPTHEEAITTMLTSMGSISVDSLPVKLYQISTKFRDEPRPKFGLLRCREFLMKDLYTFDKSIEDAGNTYNEVCGAYDTIFSKLGLNCVKAMSDCGHIGGDMSHEYLLPMDIGDDKVYTRGEDAWNSFYEAEGLSTENASVSNAIELAHAFLLGSHYSDMFKATYNSAGGKRETLQMGCYGIGVSRVLAACVEAFSGENEIRWPYSIAPFKVCIIPPKRGSKEHERIGDLHERMYSHLNSVRHLNGDVIVDDRTNRTIGKRLNDAKLLGFPAVIVIGKHVLDDDPKVEVLFQNKEQSSLIPLPYVHDFVSKEFGEVK